jgi:hypothetical protein
LISSSTKSCRRASFRFGRYFLAILGRRSGFERMNQTSRHSGYFVHSRQKCGFVGLGRLVKTGNLSHELQRRSSYLISRDRRNKIEKGFDVSAHFS